MKKKIFITGISSSIIQKLTALIDFSAYEVMGITRNSASLKLKNVKIVAGDMLKFHEVSHLLEDSYMIIHGAALTHTKREKEYYEVNLNATKKLVEAAKKYNVARFVFISSNTAGKNSGAYGLTKLLAEEYIQKEINGWTILRPSEVYGGNKKEGIDKLLNDVVNKSFVLCPTNLPSKLCPIYIEDAVQTMFTSIFNDKYVNRIAVINGSEAFSYLEIIKLAEGVLKKKVKVIPLSRGLMFFVKWTVKILPLKLGIVPDQVDRLYAIKDIQVNKNTLLKLGEYIASLVKSENS